MLFLERKKDGGFPRAKEFKLRVRNNAFPESVWELLSKISPRSSRSAANPSP